MRRRRRHASAVLVAAAVLLPACEGPTIDEDDPQVAAWHVAATDEASSAAGDWADRIAGVLPDATAPVARAAAGDLDCRQGQHSWKRNDPFDLLCTTTAVVVVAVPDPVDGGGVDAAGFVEDMAAVHRLLVDDGYEPSDEPVHTFLAGYADGFGEPTRVGREGQPVPYGPQHLPLAHYRPAEDREGLIVSLSFTGRHDRATASVVPQWHGPIWQTNDGDSLDPQTLPDLLDGYAYGLVVTASADRQW